MSNEKELDQAYEQGLVVGWQEAVAWLRKQATDAFSRDNDQLATTLKCLAREMALAARKK